MYVMSENNEQTFEVIASSPSNTSEVDSTRIIQSTAFADTESLPMDVDYIELIDHNGLCKQLNEYLKSNYGQEKHPLRYKTVAILGIQDSGKSTLLNTLFNTKFPSGSGFEEGNKTKGVYMSKFPSQDLHILDVKGYQRGMSSADEDLLQQVISFATCMADLLIINLWSNMITSSVDIDNMLRIVFDAHTSLFKKSKRTKLLFVIRDYIDTVPFDKLVTRVKEYAQEAWKKHTETSDYCASSDHLFEFFDMDFVSLPHIIHDRVNFDENASQIRDRFLNAERDDYLFQPDYWKLVAVDNLANYLNSLWKLVSADSNSERWISESANCQQHHLVQTQYEKFMTEIEPLEKKIMSGELDSNFSRNISRYLPRTGQLAKKHQKDASTDKIGLFYHRKIHEYINTLFDLQMTTAEKKLTQEFSETVDQHLAANPDNPNRNALRQAVYASKEKALAEYAKIEKRSWPSVILGEELVSRQKQLKDNLDEIAHEVRMEFIVRRLKAEITGQMEQELLKYKKTVIDGLRNAFKDNPDFCDALDKMEEENEDKDEDDDDGDNNGSGEEVKE